MLLAPADSTLRSSVSLRPEILQGLMHSCCIFLVVSGLLGVEPLDPADLNLVNHMATAALISRVASEALRRKAPAQTIISKRQKGAVVELLIFLVQILGERCVKFIIM